MVQLGACERWCQCFPNQLNRDGGSLDWWWTSSASGWPGNRPVSSLYLALLISLTYQHLVPSKQRSLWSIKSRVSNVTLCFYFFYIARRLLYRLPMCPCDFFTLLDIYSPPKLPPLGSVSLNTSNICFPHILNETGNISSYNNSNNNKSVISGARI